MSLLDNLTSSPNEGYAVSENNLAKLVQLGSFSDPLTELRRDGARRLFAHTVAAEVSAFICRHSDLKTGHGHHRIVRHGQLAESEIMTGIGAVWVCQPSVRHRATTGLF